MSYYAMSEAQIWLGKCQVMHTHQANQPDAQRYRVQVATWCNGSESFGRAVASHMAESGLTLLDTGSPLPKEQWLAQHQERSTPGFDAEAQQLANKVKQYGNTALGYLYAIPEGAATATESYLHIETLDNIEPLDGQFDAHSMKTVPDALYEPLFSQPEPTGQEIEQYGGKENIPPMKLYAILDAAKVKVPSLRSMLDTADLDFACLITGEDYEALKDSAPYIVELKEDDDFTRTLFTYNPNFPDEHLSVHLWHKEPGIYIRSRASLVEVGQHFAQFVRVQDEQGKRYFFRFWEPRSLPAYLNAIKTDDQLVSKWFTTDSFLVNELFAPVLQQDAFYRVTPIHYDALTYQPRPLILTEQHQQALQQQRRDDFKTRLKKLLLTQLQPDQAKVVGSTFQQNINRLIDEAQEQALHTERSIAHYVLATYMLKTSPTLHPQTRQILEAPNLHPVEKAERILTLAKTQYEANT